MARIPVLPAEAMTRVPVLLREVGDARAYRRLLCVKLALDGQSAEQIAATLDWNPTSVRRIWRRYRQEGEEALVGRAVGGRRRAHLTPAEEDAVLAPFLEQAAAGGVLVAGPIKAAYEARVGKAVPKSTIYRLLARHGWRTVLPRRRHPRQEAAVQEGFKTTSRAGWWTKSPAKRPPDGAAARSG